MAADNEDGEELARLTRKLLLDAGAYGRLPTPINEVVAAAGLTEPSESLLSDSALARAPQYIRAVIVPIKYKIRALLDRREKEIHLDPTIEIPGKRSFNRLHEVVHHLAPWQRDLVVADGDRDLSPATRRAFEREANEGAAQLLFQHDLIAKVASGYPTGMSTVITVKEIFGGTFRSTIRAYAGSHRKPILAISLDPSPTSRDPLSFVRNEVTPSPAWVTRFGQPWLPRVLTCPPSSWLATAAAVEPNRSCPGDEVRVDLTGRSRVIRYEVLNTTHQLLALFWDERR